MGDVNILFTIFKHVPSFQGRALCAHLIQLLCKILTQIFWQISPHTIIIILLLIYEPIGRFTVDYACERTQLTDRYSRPQRVQED